MKQTNIKNTLITIALSALVFGVIVTRPYAEQPTVIASYYGEKYRNRPTASHHKNWKYSYFNPDELTAAHKTLPFGTKLKVSYKSKSVIVVISDRGPFVKGRTLDLSKAAFAKLADLDAGLIKVKYTVLR